MSNFTRQPHGPNASRRANIGGALGVQVPLGFRLSPRPPHGDNEALEALRYPTN